MKNKITVFFIPAFILWSYATFLFAAENEQPSMHFFTLTILADKIQSRGDQISPQELEEMTKILEDLVKEPLKLTQEYFVKQTSLGFFKKLEILDSFAAKRITDENYMLPLSIFELHYRIISQMEIIGFRKMLSNTPVNFSEIEQLISKFSNQKVSVCQLIGLLMRSAKTAESKQACWDSVFRMFNEEVEDADQLSPGIRETKKSTIPLLATAILTFSDDDAAKTYKDQVITKLNLDARLKDTAGK